MPADSRFIPTQQQLVQRGKPGFRSSIGQGDPGMHLCLIASEWKSSASAKRQPVSAASQFADRGLARPGYSHEHRIIASFIYHAASQRNGYWHRLLYVVHHGGGSQSLLGTSGRFLPRANDGRGERVVRGCWRLGSRHVEKTGPPVPTPMRKALAKSQ